MNFGAEDLTGRDSGEIKHQRANLLERWNLWERQRQNFMAQRSPQT